MTEKFSKQKIHKPPTETYLYKPSPREATSVAMSIGAFPDRNSEKKKKKRKTGTKLGNWGYKEHP